MNRETTDSRSEGSVATAPAPAPAATTAASAAASSTQRFDEVLRQVKAELLSGHERRRGSNPYDSRLGRPSRDVWGTRRRA
jgi:hypothetical protein